MNDDPVLEIAPFAAPPVSDDGDGVATVEECGGVALELAVEGTEARWQLSRSPITGIVIGRVVAASAAEGVRVDHPANPSDEALAALSTVELRAADVGREVALAFEQGDATRPIVLGLIHHPVADSAGGDAWSHAAITSDGERVTISADREIVLRCGGASITLTRAGKILIRGAYLLSRSTGVNRIKGGSVQIN